jgi:hypothetical protein
MNIYIPSHQNESNTGSKKLFHKPTDIYKKNVSKLLKNGYDYAICKI